jgi:hypothetical protein
MQIIKLSPAFLLFSLGSPDTLMACDLEINTGQTQICRTADQIEVSTPSLQLQTRQHSSSSTPLHSALEDEDLEEDDGSCWTRSNTSQTALPGNSGVSVQSSSVTVCQ